MAVTGANFPKNTPMQLPDINKRKKYCVMQHQSLINEDKQKTQKNVSYPIHCPFLHLHQKNQIKMKLTKLRIYFNVVRQVHTSQKKASTKCGHLIPQVHNIEVKWYIKPCIVITKEVS